MASGLGVSGALTLQRRLACPLGCVHSARLGSAQEDILPKRSRRPGLAYLRAPPKRMLVAGER